MRIRDGKNSDPGSEMEKIRIQDPGYTYPQHWNQCRKKIITKYVKKRRKAVEQTYILYRTLKKSSWEML
jgi:hypothetical protein